MSEPGSDDRAADADRNSSDDWEPSEEWSDPASLAEGGEKQDWDEGVFGGADHDVPIEPGDPTFENALFVALGSLSTVAVLLALLGII